MPPLTEFPFYWTSGYYPSSASTPPPGLQSTIRAGANCWLRPMNRVEVANGIAQTSAQNVGARIFSFNTQRATIEGGYVSSRLPNAGLLRYQNAAMLYLSELTSKQVYLDESAVTGLTTSATAGMLRVGLPGSPWSVYDCGFDAPSLPSGNVSTDSSGTKSMTGSTGVALAAWRSKTNAISAPSNVVYKSMDGSTATRFLVALPSAVSGQDGWVLAGTNWGDASGNVRVVRYVYVTVRGTFTATNGSPNLTSGSSTKFLRDLRAGDVVTIGGGSYTIQSVTSDTAAVLTGNYTGSTGSQTATITTAIADYRTGELGDLLSYDVIKPVRAAGLLQYAGRVFLWGCYGQDSSSVTGPAIVPLLPSNPEHIHPTIAILTSYGDDLLNVLPSETRLFLLTAGTIESVTFTASDAEPYRIRVLHQPGIVAATNAVVYRDQLYVFSGRPIRTIADDNMDTEFGAPVWSAMSSWDASRVTMHIDPKNQAVLYAHHDGASTTTIIPYMATLGVWGVPHTVSGQLVDSTVAGGSLYLTLLSGGNYRVQTWEGGSAGSASSPYICTQFQDGGSLTSRKVMKALTVTGKVSSVRPYVIRAGTAIPDVTSTGAAVATISLSGSEKSEKEVSVHINDFRALALRVDFPTGGMLDSLTVRGYAKAAGK